MLPGDSRTSVQHDTFAGLTAGFGMGPGVSRQLWQLSSHVFKSSCLSVLGSEIVTYEVNYITLSKYGMNK
jgi:hypothetical protein